MEEKHLEELQAYMEEDGFDAIHSGDNICFQRGRDLSDGHHRVFAVSKTDKPVEVFCFFGTTIASRSGSGLWPIAERRGQVSDAVRKTGNSVSVADHKYGLRLFIFNKYKGKMVARSAAPSPVGSPRKRRSGLTAPAASSRERSRLFSVQTKGGVTDAACRSFVHHHRRAGLSTAASGRPLLQSAGDGPRTRPVRLQHHRSPRQT